MSTSKLSTYWGGIKCLAGTWLQIVESWSIASTSLQGRCFPVSRRGKKIKLRHILGDFKRLFAPGFALIDIILVPSFTSSLFLQRGVFWT